MLSIERIVTLVVDCTVQILRGSIFYLLWDIEAVKFEPSAVLVNID